MPDNWNKLADLLGTPSINPIERRPSAPKTPTKSKDSTTAKVVSSDSEPELPSKRVVEASEPFVQLDEPVTVAPAAPPEPKSKFKSTWDAVADFFGVGAPEKEEPVAPAPQPVKPVKTSMWQNDDDDDDSRNRRASQKASDELLGLKGPSTSAEPDLDTLLSGFRTPPPQPTLSVQAPAEREIERAPREHRRREEPSQRSRRPEPRGRDLPRESEPQADGSRSRSEPRRRPGPRTADTPDQVEERGTSPERRGQRRPSRRAASESTDSQTSENIDSIRDEDSTVDRSRRGQRRSSSQDRTRRSETVRDEAEFAPELEVRRPRTSAWDDPSLADRSSDEASDFESDIKSEEPTDGEGTRRRRRRRRPRGESLDADAGEDTMASTGRQIYGRHSDEGEDGDAEVEQLRTAVVVPWVDAISGLIEKNMKNHRNPPSGGGTRGRGGERRR